MVPFISSLYRNKSNGTEESKKAKYVLPSYNFNPSISVFTVQQYQSLHLKKQQRKKVIPLNEIPKKCSEKIENI